MDFKPDDKVRHAAQPGWGVGIVLSAQKATHDGKPCQRLTVRFDQAGKKTISTAFADLRPLDPGTPPSPPTPPKADRNRQVSRPPQPPAPPRPAAPAQPPPASVLKARLEALPEQLSDPFRPLAERLDATARAYRHDPRSRDLLDWAVAQTGLHDPLSVFSRHELEQHFATFRIHLDRHLKSLLDECRTSRVDPRPLLAEAGPGVQQALRRVNPGR